MPVQNLDFLGGEVSLKVKNVTNYYVTEVSFEAPVDLREVQEWVRSSKSNAEVIAMYCSGGVLGVSMKQRSKISSSLDSRIRELLGIKNMSI